MKWIRNLFNKIRTDKASYRLDLNKCQIIFMAYVDGKDVTNYILELDTNEGELLVKLIDNYFKQQNATT